MSTTEGNNIFIRVKKEDVGFISTIIESFEGVASVRTPNPEPGAQFTILQCIVSPDQTRQMDMILRDLSKDHYLKRVEESAPPKS